MKRFLAMMLIMACLLTGVLAAGEISGYDKKAGYVYVTFGQYPQGADGAVLPIRWRVLRVEGTTAHLLSDLVLDVHPVESDATGFDGWETAELRSWMEETFGEAAFGEEEQTALVADEQGERVTLPEADTLKDAALGFARDKDRTTQATPYAQAQGIKTYNRGEAAYWMRTRSTSNRSSQRLVISGGKLGYLNVASPDIGIRPVVALSLDIMEVTGGSGTQDDPYQLSVSKEAVEQARIAREQAEAEARRAEEAARFAQQQKEMQEQQALADAQQALADAQQALADAQGKGTDKEQLAALATRVEQAQQAYNKLTMTEREGFPILTAAGFLPEGEPEFIFEDPENGLWRYANQDLLIEITRVSREGPLRYLAAEVLVREGTPAFRMVPHDAENMLKDAQRYVEKPAQIAKNNNLVFSIDGDYFLYRIGRRRSVKTFSVGVVIRQGQLLMDSPPIPSRNTYPPLDMLALYPDGDMRAYAARERTAQELLEEGAVDVLSFGPWLIRDGEINTSYTTYGTSLQPRVAVGMVEKGHYWCVIVEGRIKESRGMTCRQVGDLMAELGCDMAFNLDGGWTSAMVFMGKQLNQLDRSGVKDNARPQNEVMGIGVTHAYK